MIRLTYSNRTEALVDALVERLEARRASGISPLVPVHLVVPNRNLERFLELAIAEATGIAANLRFHRLERFVARWVQRELPGARPLGRRGYESLVLAALLDEAWLAEPEVAALRHYLEAGEGEDPGARDTRRAQLALRLGRLFEGYGYSRPELLAAWARGGSAPGGDAVERWQAALWRRMRALAGRGAGGARWLALHEALLEIERRPPTPGALPAEVHVFGLSYVARIFQWVFELLGRADGLHLYVLNPCMEFWEDVPSESELQARLRRPPRRLSRRGAPTHTPALRRLELLEDEDEPEPAAASPEDPPPLTWWGRPGREHVHLLNELTGADFEPRFVDPAAADRLGEGEDETAAATEGVLAALQRDVLERAPEPAKPAHDDDGSVRALACASVRREVEAVADEIWRLVRASEGTERPLRFNEIAVFVHGDDRDAYLPHVASVFQEAQRLPHHVVDLPLTADSRIAEAATLLLDVLLSRFRRPEVLALLGHPALRVPGGDVVAPGGEMDRSAWAHLVDRLGIFHGLDRSDHAETYIDRDLVNWEQGVRRLVLGAFLGEEAETGGGETPWHFDGEAYVPEPAEADDRAPALALLVRSLAADARFARDACLPLREWAAFFAGLFRGYLRPRTEREESELRRCLAAAQGLSERDLGAAGAGQASGEDPASGEEEPGPRVGVRVATEILREALSGLGGARGEYLADGVVVSALTPMRAIPFRVAFLLGMGEGRFPTTERRDPLDLRARRRRVGDVTPAERDKYVFLEALLCARERFYVSWVSRDALTGDPIEPSPVVKQLLELLGRAYVRGGADALVERRALRRHEDVDLDGPFAEARAEAEAQALGEAARATAGRAVSIEVLRDFTAEDTPKARRLRRLLALPPLPEGEGEGDGDEGPLRVRLASIRRFLEDPIQGWAQAVLGLGEAPSDAHVAREDEPFAPEVLDATGALRGAFEEALRARRPPPEMYRAETERLLVHGRWPLGALREDRARRDGTVLDGWRRVFGHSVARGMTQPMRMRFGPSRDTEASDRVRDPLVVPVRLPGGVREVEVVGPTQVLVEEGRASMVLVPKAAPPPGKALQRERLRYALRGFLDHVALTIADGADRDMHRALVLYGGDAAQDASTVFGALDPGSAERWLSGVLGELLGAQHDVFFPAEAVFWDPRGWPALTGAKLAHAIERVRRQRRSRPFSIGPVPREHEYPAPPEEALLAMAQRRFGLFFRLVGLAPGADARGAGA